MPGDSSCSFGEDCQTHASSSAYITLKSRVQSFQIGKLYKFLLLLLLFRSDGRKMPSVLHSTTRLSFRLGFSPIILFQGLGPSGKQGHATRLLEVSGRWRCGEDGKQSLTSSCIPYLCGDPNLSLPRLPQVWGHPTVLPGEGPWEMGPQSQEKFFPPLFR